MKKLKIAVLASNFIRIPPTPAHVPAGYSGAPEMIAHLISDGLAKRGHKITLFASSDSKTRGKLVSIGLPASSTNKNIGVGKHVDYENILLSKAYQMAQKGVFDLIHSHYDLKGAHYAPLVKTPTVTTLHSPLDKLQTRLKFYKKTQYYISISNAQRRPIPDMKYAATIYHGLELNKLPFDAKPLGYFTIIGRIVPEKGVHLAIKTARQLKKKLIIMGEAPPGSKYFAKEVKPYIDGKNIMIKGFLKREHALSILKNADAMLFPIQWEEPFGLTMIEAMGCGTPVVAIGRGSVPEIIKHEKTGFIAHDLATFVSAARKIHTIDRAECRQYVEKRFNVERMVDDYEKTFYKIVKKS